MALFLVWRAASAAATSAKLFVHICDMHAHFTAPDDQVCHDQLCFHSRGCQVLPACTARRFARCNTTKGLTAPLSALHGIPCT
jgi:hypothetical protein